MLQLKNIHKTFNLGTINEKIALDGVNLVLNEGDFVTVIGGNGAGKSTLFLHLSNISVSFLFFFFFPNLLHLKSPFPRL